MSARVCCPTLSSARRLGYKRYINVYGYGLSFLVKLQSLLARTVPSIFCICMSCTAVPFAKASSKIPARSSSAIQGGLYPHALGVFRIRGAWSELAHEIHTVRLSQG